MNLDNLKNLPREQLMDLAAKQGLKIHWNSKPETIIKAIADSVMPQAPVRTGDTKASPIKEPVFNTKEQVEEAIAHIKAKVPQFVSSYNDEERTVKFSCKGAEETFNLSVPLRVLRNHAQTVARGRIALMGRPEFERGNAVGNSAYTNVVLA